MRQLKSIMLATWLLFIVYAFVLAPIEDGGTNYLKQMITMDSPDPLLVTVFSLLGVWPMVFGILLVSKDKATIPAWPFVLGSFALGAFALFPYFIFHYEKRNRTNRTSQRLYRTVTNIYFPLTLFIISIALLLYGLVYGSFSDYQQAFWESRFVHTMTIDFMMLTLLSLLGISHHAYYQNDRSLRSYWPLGFIPLLGPLIYILIAGKRNVETE
ncbi:hypothetical protein IMZ31_18035 [Pontibacillus sp. ALD_SL1]|uniref:hypothetical protein n=1 Tax=Pontibacillus sp. ALD_SL1 TaxID=2777185 RepID=UPI001A95E952|nr:hypothetical protein [Pontibacillus sp. ALD_SL1]QSS99933.1 hypothetical protein IMZ31_18035 [Pontibacillus sp. ALD_SL1]